MNQPAGTVKKTSHKQNASAKRAFSIGRFFTRENKHPYDEISWERRRAAIYNSKGDVIFEQRNVEVPSFWSQTATDIVCEKYFSGHVGKKDRESSVRQIVDRVSNTLTNWGREYGYFNGVKEERAFNEELKYIFVNQIAAFNSPVWFNVGVEETPQCSACFILSVDDDKDSIMRWYRDEMFIFSGGSGAGVNVSGIRSSKEMIARKGKASGPVSFMKGADAIAGTIKSGGKTRRAAKMVVLNVDHPDIRDFIVCKWHEEEKAKALISMGWDGAIDGDVYDNTFFQNANNSVRVTDEFMKAVIADTDWELKAVTTGEITDVVRARDIMQLIAEATWHCADPGMQYDTTINKWHTVSVTGRINASNPCSEYMHLDNSACNLASLNLMKFLRKDDTFDVEKFSHVVRILTVAMDIIVSGSSYPTEKITENAKAFRELGLGFANLGSLLMYQGLPYDSDEGRALAGGISAIMTGEAYLTSTHLAERIGPFAGFDVNRIPMQKVLKMHRKAVDSIDAALVPKDILKRAVAVWDKANARAERVGVRNSQASVLAPTGTIAFMMDCTTTGIEPDFALVKYKKLVGGGFLKLVNNTVPHSLLKLGYEKKQVEEIVNYIEQNDRIEGAPHIKDKDLAVFDCATNAPGGVRAISAMGHIRMMAAAQPFISGAISKTVNLPESATVDEISDIYISAWKLGLKAIAIYRDGSKAAQPLNTAHGGDSQGSKKDSKLSREIPPADVVSKRHKFSIMGHDGYLHYGLFGDGRPAEVFIRMAKEGSTISGLLDSIGILVSVSLQYGVTIETIIRKFAHTRFEPAGFTDNPDIPAAKSILDYIAKYLAIQFLTPDEQRRIGVYVEKYGGEDAAVNVGEAKVELASAKELPEAKATVAVAVPAYQDAPACRCGEIMVRTGACYTCRSCGESLGACS